MCEQDSDLSRAETILWQPRLASPSLSNVKTLVALASFQVVTIGQSSFFELDNGDEVAAAVGRYGNPGRQIPSSNKSEDACRADVHIFVSVHRSSIVAVDIECNSESLLGLALWQARLLLLLSC
jgi:hypothetical protein